MVRTIGSKLRASRWIECDISLGPCESRQADVSSVIIAAALHCAALPLARSVNSEGFDLFAVGRSGSLKQEIALSSLHFRVWRSRQARVALY